MYVPACTLKSAEIFKTFGMCRDVEILLHSPRSIRKVNQYGHSLFY